MTIHYDDEVKQLLVEFIAQAKAHSTTLPSDAIKAKIQIINFQNNIAQFLDYVYSNFPSGENTSRYFPRSHMNETMQKYLGDIKQHQKNMSANLEAFLISVFPIIKSNNYSISLIDSKIKHEKPSSLLHKTGIKVLLRGHIPDGLLVEENDGVLNLANVFSIPADAENIRISNITVVDQRDKVLLDNIDVKFGQVPSGKITIALRNSSPVELVFTDWANGCIDTCEQIFTLVSKD